jgi:hypothetical protein
MEGRMTTYDSESTEWCPQHGYTLPCPKCGMGEYERGLKDGRKEVAEWLSLHWISKSTDDAGTYEYLISQLDAKLKEWGI